MRASMGPQAHILIVEDHPLYRDALARVLAGPRSGVRCSAAATEPDALERLQQHGDVDLVIADYALAQGNGLALLAAVGARWPTVARVLLSGLQDASLPARARSLGLMAFVPKSLEPETIADVIRRVMDGEPWFPPADPESTAPVLTPRQATVLACAAAGMANKGIARELGVSVRTVKFHLQESFVRLQAGSRTEAVARALEHGLIGAQR